MALDAHIESLQAIVRPTWATGMTSQELERIARHEGLNPYAHDWGDKLDPVVIREAKQGEFRHETDVTIRELRANRPPRRKIRKRKARKTDTRARTGYTPETATTFKRGVYEPSAQVADNAFQCGCAPYIDILTFGRWRALGRPVRKGQKGTRIGRATLFCACQVEPEEVAS